MTKITVVVAYFIHTGRPSGWMFINFYLEAYFRKGTFPQVRWTSIYSKKEPPWGGIGSSKAIHDDKYTNMNSVGLSLSMMARHFHCGLCAKWCMISKSHHLWWPLRVGLNFISVMAAWSSYSTHMPNIYGRVCPQSQSHVIDRDKCTTIVCLVASPPMVVVNSRLESVLCTFSFHQQGTVVWIKEQVGKGYRYPEGRKAMIFSSLGWATVRDVYCMILMTNVRNDRVACTPCTSTRTRTGAMIGVWIGKSTYWMYNLKEL